MMHYTKSLAIKSKKLFIMENALIICLIIFFTNISSIASIINYTNQSMFNDTIGASTLYTINLGNLSGGETFYIVAQSDSISPWELTIYKSSSNGNRLPWISCQCMPPQKVIETKVIDAGSYQLELKPRPIRVEANIAMAKINPGDISSSIEWHLSVVKNMKIETSADELRKDADNLSDQGKYNEAIQFYDKALEINPQDYRSWNNKGIAFDSLGRFEEAIGAYDKAIVLNSSAVNIRINKGKSLYDQAKYNESIQAYDTGIEIDPNYIEAWLGKGLALCAQGKYNEALISSEKAIAIDPNSTDSWILKSDALFKQGEYDKSLQASEKAIELEPDAAMAWNNKAAALGKLGIYDAEIDACNRTIELNPYLGIAWYNKGIALNNLGQTTKANDAFSKAKELGYTG